jgi:hypothetical protein
VLRKKVERYEALLKELEEEMGQEGALGEGWKKRVWRVLKVFSFSFSCFLIYFLLHLRYRMDELMMIVEQVRRHER